MRGTRWTAISTNDNMNAYLVVVMLCIGGPGDVVENLSNADDVTRYSALIDLELQRRRLEAALLDQLDSVLTDRDKSHHGRTHTVLQAVASMRADNTVPKLLEAVDFTLDPDTFPIGDRHFTSSYYPVAEALREIGSKAVITGILSAAADKERDAKVLRIYAWVLIKILGKDVARVAVEREKVGHIPIEQQRILTLYKMIEEEPLLERPPFIGG